jgi:hypothetical protein
MRNFLVGVGRQPKSCPGESVLVPLCSHFILHLRAAHTGRIPKNLGGVRCRDFSL